MMVKNWTKKKSNKDYLDKMKKKVGDNNLVDRAAGGLTEGAMFALGTAGAKIIVKVAKKAIFKI